MASNAGTGIGFHINLIQKEREKEKNNFAEFFISHKIEQIGE